MARQTAILKAAARQWTPFQKVTITESMRSDYPLLMNCHSIYANSRLEVQLFPVDTSIGGVMQCTAHRHGDLAQPSWEEVQRAIHEIFGENTVAVEVYPALKDEWKTNLALRVVWILPVTYELPFGLEKPNSWGRHVQTA